MLFSELNPFLRYARLHPANVEGDRPRAAYDYRIFYVLDGSATFLTEGEEIPLSEGTALFLRPGVFYRFAGRLKIIVVNFDLTRRHATETTPRTPDEADAFRRDLVFGDDPPKELEERIVLHRATVLEPLLRQCVSENLCPGTYSDALTSALLKEILCILAEESEETAHESPKIVQEVMLYLRENFDRELKNTDIAAAFGYHPFYLNRLFKEHTGKTIHQTLLSVRIRNAKGLLKRTSLPVEEIVRESGFSDRAQFCIAFRRATGMTPSEYRKHHT